MSSVGRRARRMQTSLGWHIVERKLFPFSIWTKSNFCARRARGRWRLFRFGAHRRPGDLCASSGEMKRRKTRPSGQKTRIQADENYNFRILDVLGGLKYKNVNFWHFILH